MLVLVATPVHQSPKEDTMQGIFICGSRPKSKKQVKEEVAAYNAGGDGYRLVIEATSVTGNEYDGSIANAPDGEFHFVGPDPYVARNFYGTLVKSGGKVTVR